MGRYIIVGAGAVGGTIGGRLYEAGHDIVLVARGAHYEAMRKEGLRLITPDGDRTLPIPTVDRPEAVDLLPDDVLILATKTQDSAAALDAWAARPVSGGHAGTGATAGAVLPVVLAQNGVENERLALRRFSHVYGASVWLPAGHLEPGVVESRGTPISGILHLGRYPGGEDDTARRISAALEKSKFRAPVCVDVMRWKYAKLVSNLANSIEALCGPTDDPRAQELRRRVKAEGESVLVAAGIDYATDEERAPYVALLRMEPAAAGRPQYSGSTWQSLARATGSVETDYLNGEIALLGRCHGVPTPANEALQRAVGQFAREQRPAGSFDPDRLAELIDLTDQYRGPERTE
ncbi:MAG TPA: 2-dehydropantoate 2-reductase N-terminal domain-containing protein [Actinocrinis sp.]|nr:2-dehydropantoate 2-reductase N-terminal domain-containing protein [Actinocrinis sp.]